MSTNKSILDTLDEIDELLEIAQVQQSLGKNIYDSGKSSVWNYNNINNFKNGFKDEIAFRIPLDLAYLHYLDWLKTNYPHILHHSLDMFSKEILEYINHVKVKNIYYLLIRNCAQFRKYTDHPYNQFLKERARKRYNAWQKKNR